jgi:hypothetical protein
VVTSPRLGHRDGLAQRVTQLHEVHQDNVIHDRADAELRHVVRHAEQLGVLIIEEGGDEPLLAVGHQGVEEIAVQLLVLQRGAVAGHAVNHQPLDVILVEGLAHAMKVGINVKLLRVLIEQTDGAGLQLRAQVKA